MMTWILAFILALAAQQAPAPQQQKPAEQKPDQAQPTFGATSNEVILSFSVLDMKDRLVTDLKQQNFVVYEDGKKMDIKSFTPITKVPLRIALLMDTSNSVRLHFKAQQEAAIDFVHTILEANPKNRMFLMSFDFTKDFVTPFTDDADLLAGKIRKLKPGGGTALHDAIVKASRERMGKELELGGLQRVIVLVTDGEDDTSKYSLAEAINEAKHSSVALYSISTNVAGYAGDGDEILEKMAAETGGRVVYPWKKPPSAEYATGYISRTQIDGSNSVYGLGTGQYSSETAENLALALNLIQRELQQQYSLSYAPPNPTPDGRFHQIKLVVDVDGLKVRARKGYFPPLYQ
jgi:Mg-chelatase subunit ChlD